MKPISLHPTRFVWLLLTLLVLSACQQTPAPNRPDVDTLAATPGIVAAWGDNVYGQTDVPAGLKDVVSIAGGYVHSLALKADGTVVAWGDNVYGQTTVPAGLSGVVAVAGGGHHSLARKSDGSVVAWGYNISGQTNVPAELDDAVVVAVAGGFYHSLALKADGSVMAWGDNTSGQTTIPAGLKDVVAIAGGGFYSLALVSSPSTVYAFSGFFAPVDNLPVVNVVKAGSAVPVKFSLGGDFGLDIFESGFPKSQPVACESAAPQDPVSETVTAGSSSLSYDAVTDRYAYVWKTDKGWANTCRLLTLELSDGSEHTALFRFTR